MKSHEAPTAVVDGWLVHDLFERRVRLSRQLRRGPKSWRLGPLSPLGWLMTLGSRTIIIGY